MCNDSCNDKENMEYSKIQTTKNKSVKQNVSNRQKLRLLSVRHGPTSPASRAKSPPPHALSKKHQTTIRCPNKGPVGICCVCLNAQKIVRHCCRILMSSSNERVPPSRPFCSSVPVTSSPQTLLFPPLTLLTPIART